MLLRYLRDFLLRLINEEAVMEITCPTCNASYNISDDKIPEGKKVSAKCKKCGGRIVVEASVKKARPAAPEAELVISMEDNKPRKP